MEVKAAQDKYKEQDQEEEEEEEEKEENRNTLCQSGPIR